MSCATPFLPADPLGHVPEMNGHVAEIVGHDPETAGHVRPKYAPMLQLKDFLRLLGLDTTKTSKYEGVKKIYKYMLDLESSELMERYRKIFMKRTTEVRVQQNLLDGGNMMVVTETPEKPKRMKFMNVDTKPAKKWEELTPRQRRQELLKTPRTPKSQPVEPNPFDRDEGIIPLKPIDD